jgi:glycosyltransferase involved in cell wall biosynthesis
MLVSVIIPCYNVVGFIEECLESVYGQEHKPLEVICVNNNSTDETLSQLQKLKLSHYSDLLILEESKKGANAARNCGLNHATGEWIQFLDADDLLLPAKISTQVTTIKKHGFRGFIAASATRLKVNGEKFTYELQEDDPYLAAFIGKAGTTCSNLWSKEWLNNVNGWDESIQSSQEADLMLRLLVAGSPVLFDQNSQTILRDRTSGQISQSDPSKRWSQLILTRIHFLKNIREVNRPAYEKNQQQFSTYLLSSLLTLAKYDRSKALELYKLINFSSWKPEPGFGISKSKAVLLKFLGFPLFSRLR